jgi:uncharacterized protein
VFNKAIAALTALLLGACQQAELARPVLWQVDGPAGERAWLLGTIHALPEPVSLESAAFSAAVSQADQLIVEVAALEDDTRTAAIFQGLARTPIAPPLVFRAPPDVRPQLQQFLLDNKIDPNQFNETETWAAALSLAQVLSAKAGDRGENGADRLVLRAMRGKPVREFEGAKGQLSIFDSLPEREQADLLALVVRSSTENLEESRRLQAAWRKGDLAALSVLDSQGLLADPELRAALLVGRNEAWLEQLVPILRRGQKPLVAVGTLHLVGPDGLPARLQAQGFRVTRVQ